MQCPRCQSENTGIVNTFRNRTADGKYSSVTDLRIYVCGKRDRSGRIADGCGKQWPVECSIAGVEVYDEDSMSMIVVTLEEYKKKYLPRESQSRHYPLFGDDV